MSDLKSLISALDLENDTGDKTEPTEHKFSMFVEDQTEHKHYKSNISPYEDRRGKYPRTEVHRTNLAISMRERWQDPEFREKMSKAQRGVPHKIRGPYRSRTGQSFKWSEESKKALSESRKGTIFINNGVECHRWKKDLPMPEGYVRGKLPPSEESKRKTSETMKRLWREYKERLESEQNEHTENM